MSSPAPNVPGASTLSEAEAKRLTLRGRRLAQVTVAYNVLEGIIAITAGALRAWSRSSV